MNVSDIMGHCSPPTQQPSPTSSASDSNITLWQFLFELLSSEKHSDIIQWTRTNDGEFKLIDAEAVARLWGQRKAKPHMNYDKLSRALRYYYEKNIIKKVIGQKFVYRFVTVGGIKMEKEAIKDEPIYEFNGYSGSKNVSSSPAGSACSPSSSVSSSSASLMLVNSSISPIPSTSSPQVHEDVSPTTSSTTTPREIQNQNQNRKRSRSPIDSTSSPSTAKTTKSEPQARRMKPNPLNLTAATNFMPPATTTAATTATFSPMLFLHQNSPLFQPAMSHLYAIASLASAGLYGPQMSPLLAAAAATSPFRSPLNTPKTNGGPNESVPTTQPQIFQFPPTSTSLINPFSGLVSPVAPFMMSSPATNTFKFPSSESLKTPTVPLKMPSI